MATSFSYPKFSVWNGTCVRHCSRPVVTAERLIAIDGALMVEPGGGATDDAPPDYFPTGSSPAGGFIGKFGSALR